MGMSRNGLAGFSGTGTLLASGLNEGEKEGTVDCPLSKRQHSSGGEGKERGTIPVHQDTGQESSARKERGCAQRAPHGR